MSEYMDSLLQKMMQAGWVEKSFAKDVAEGQQQRGIQWTKDGRAKLCLINTLILEVESMGGLTQNELIALRELARLHPPIKFKNPGDSPPSPRSRLS